MQKLSNSSGTEQPSAKASSSGSARFAQNMQRLPSASARSDLSVSPFQINGQRLLVISFPAAEEQGMGSLSPAEKHVAQLVLQGHSNAQISAIRRTALRTTANQVASIFRKYGVSGRADLATALLMRRE